MKENHNTQPDDHASMFISVKNLLDCIETLRQDTRYQVDHGYHEAISRIWSHVEQAIAPSPLPKPDEPVKASIPDLEVLARELYVTLWVKRRKGSWPDQERERWACEHEEIKEYYRAGVREIIRLLGIEE